MDKLKKKFSFFKNVNSIKDIIRIVAYIFLFWLVFLCIYTFFVTDILKKDYVNVFGYTYFTVSTGSMSGTIEVNDVIFVKVTDKAKVGDIITYKNKKNEIITHRVVQKVADTYITQGDINNVADDPVLKEDVIGKVKFIISPSFILKLIAVFLILFIFLSLINFDKIVKKYIVNDKNNNDSLPKVNEVPDELFQSEPKKVEEPKSTGKTIWIPVDEIKNINIDDDESNDGSIELLDDDSSEILDDEFLTEKNFAELCLVDEVVNLLKMRNNLLINSRINKKWVIKFQYVYTLALHFLNNDAKNFKKLISNPSFDEIFDYDLDKIGFYETLRSRIFDMPIYVYIRLMIYTVMYNDVEYFDGIYKILKYKVHLDVKNKCVNSRDSYSNVQIKILIKFMKDFVSNYDNKNAFELDKIDKLVKIKNYNRK